MLIKGIFIAIVTALIIGWISKKNYTNQNLTNDAEGRTKPNKLLSIVCIIGSVCFSILGFYTAFVEDIGISGWGLGIGFLIGSIVFVMSLSPKHQLHWTTEHVEGASKLFYGFLMFERTRIEWKDVVETGSTFSGYTYIQTSDGRRIYWNFLQKGSNTFEGHLLSRCPNISA